MATKNFCDRCEKEIEGKSNKRGQVDLCNACSNEYDKFMKGKEERKTFL